MPRNKISDFDKTLRATIAANLKKYSAAFTQGQLSEMTGIPASTISGYFAERSTPNAGQVQKLADALGVDKCDIDPRFSSIPFHVKPQRHRTVKIPVLGSIVAGAPETAFSDVIDWFEIPEELAKHGDYFVLKVHGDSMSPEICDGDHVVIRHQETAESGDICVVCINGDECTVKEIQRSTEGIMLVGYNRDVYTPTFYGNEEIERLPLRIEGIVVQCIRKYKEF